MQYVALLRAINVGGHSGVKMADLKPLFESLGFDDVKTYIQTGNILFKSNETGRKKLVRQIESVLEKSLGYETKVFLYSPEDLKKVIADCPYVADKRTQCQILFLEKPPAKQHEKALMDIEGDEYRFTIKNTALYYAYDKVQAGKRRQVNFEKILGVAGTGRNWNVVNKLIGLTAS